MLRLLLMVWVMVVALSVLAQEKKPITVKITDAAGRPLSRASAVLLKPDSSSVVKYSLSDTAGIVQFQNTGLPVYLLRVSMTNFKTQVETLANDGNVYTVMMAEKVLSTIKVESRKPPLELKPDRMVMNVDASITGTGTTLLELLEKMPGLTVDAEGNITMKGKTGITVTMDGKPTHLTGSELANLLGSMTSSQISQVELIDNPPPGMEAQGSGVINFKTKKGLQKGFNGTVSTTAVQGRYPKAVNNLALNFHAGKVNTFLNYTLNTREYFSEAIALRTYFKNDGTVKSLLDQPSYLASGSTSHTLRTGVDFSFSPNTSVGLAFSNVWSDRTAKGNNTAFWKNITGAVDSVLRTISFRGFTSQNPIGTFSFSHRFSSRRELSADVDAVGYRFRDNQYIENSASGSTEAYRGYIPSDIDIFSAKADYSEQAGSVSWSAGVKTSGTRTDNLADYGYNSGNGIWRTDLGKTNHFFYRENNHQLYTQAEGKWDRWNVQGGLRFEFFNYKARQLIPKDSSFWRHYGSLFPSLSISFDKDSSNTFAFTAGRRIDRPYYSRFNPFVLIYNKYTYQHGDPYLRPQFVWNLQLSHSYKNTLLTSVGYSLTTDYIMQVFPVVDGIVTYTYGNLGRMENLNASVGFQKDLTKRWSAVLQTQAVYKHFKGVVLNTERTAHYTQYNINLSNTLRFGKNWTGEVSGFYNSSRQEDVQEVVYPNGQLSAGVAKGFAQGRGSVKLSVRDLFYTNWFEGLSQFSNATEYFKITNDSRYVSLAFTWRFGKAYKTPQRSEGSAREEMERANADRQ